MKTYRGAVAGLLLLIIAMFGLHYSEKANVPYVPAHVPGLITAQAKPTLDQQLAACKAQLDYTTTPQGRLTPNGMAQVKGAAPSNCWVETDDDGTVSVYGRRP